MFRFSLRTTPFSPHALLITKFATKVARQMPLVEQEPLTLLSLEGVRFAQTWLFFCVVFCPFSISYCVVSFIHGFWLPFWYCQTFLPLNSSNIDVNYLYFSFYQILTAILCKRLLYSSRILTAFNMLKIIRGCSTSTEYWPPSTCWRL